MSGGFLQSVPSSPGFSIIPGLQYPYSVQQNPVVYMSSPQVQFPPPVQPVQSQIFHPQALPSQVGQSMVLIPVQFGQQQLISSQFSPQNIISSLVPTPPSSSGSGKNSESTIAEPTQTIVNSCPTESSNQIYNGGFVKNGEVYYLLEPVSCLQPDQNSTGGIGNVEESSSTSNNSITCQCELCSGRLPSAPSSSSSSSTVYTSSNGVATSQQQNSLPLSSWNFPLHQPTPTPVHQCLFYPVQPTPIQFPSFPMSIFDENFYRSSFIRKDAAWFKVKKNSQPQTPPKPMCGFCKSNREPKEVYRGHWIRNDAGELTCPSLRKYVCPVCQATGGNAHTIKYCPVAPAPTSNPSESEISTNDIGAKEN